MTGAYKLHLMHPTGRGGSSAASALPVRRLRLRFPGSANAPRAAREALADLECDVGAEALWKARQAVAEVVANSLVHGGASDSDTIEVEAILTATSLRIEVSDRKPAFEPPLDALTTMAEAGHSGLFIVNELADRWGITPEPGGVWFEVDHTEATIRSNVTSTLHL